MRVFEAIIQPMSIDACMLRWRIDSDAHKVSTIGSEKVSSPKTPTRILFFFRPSRSISSPAKNMM